MDHSSDRQPERAAPRLVPVSCLQRRFSSFSSSSKSLKPFQTFDVKSPSRSRSQLLALHIGRTVQCKRSHLWHSSVLRHLPRSPSRCQLRIELGANSRWRRAGPDGLFMSQCYKWADAPSSFNAHLFLNAVRHFWVTRCSMSESP